MLEKRVDAVAGVAFRVPNIYGKRFSSAQVSRVHLYVDDFSRHASFKDRWCHVSANRAIDETAFIFGCLVFVRLTD